MVGVIGMGPWAVPLPVTLNAGVDILIYIYT